MKINGREVDLRCYECNVSISDEPLLECGDRLLCHGCRKPTEECEHCSAKEDLTLVGDWLLCPECKHEVEAESGEAARFEFYAHGDTSGLVARGEWPSEYDLDPGVKYNDAGEPLGYM